MNPQLAKSATTNTQTRYNENPHPFTVLHIKVYTEIVIPTVMLEKHGIRSMPKQYGVVTLLAHQLSCFPEQIVPL